MNINRYTKLRKLVEGELWEKLDSKHTTYEYLREHAFNLCQEIEQVIAKYINDFEKVKRKHGED